MSEICLKLPRRRETCARRKSQIIEAALTLAARVGAQGLVRDRIAEEAGVASPLLHRHFGAMDTLRDIIIEEAFKRGAVDVLFKSLSIEDFKRLNESPVLSDMAIEYLRMT